MYSSLLVVLLTNQVIIFNCEAFKHIFFKPNAKFILIFQKLSAFVTMPFINYRKATELLKKHGNHEYHSLC